MVSKDMSLLPDLKPALITGLDCFASLAMTHNYPSLRGAATKQSRLLPRSTLSTIRHARPRPLRAPQAFKRLAHAEHTEIVEAAADNLHADRKARCVVSAIDQIGGIFRHVPWNRVSDMLERAFGIVEGSGEFGVKFHHRRDRRNHVIQIGKELCGRGADRHGGIEAAHDIDA